MSYLYCATKNAEMLAFKLFCAQKYDIARKNKLNETRCTSHSDSKKRVVVTKGHGTCLHLGEISCERSKALTKVASVDLILVLDLYRYS